MISASHKIPGSYISLFCGEIGVPIKFITLILVLSLYQLEINYVPVEGWAVDPYLLWTYHCSQEGLLKVGTLHFHPSPLKHICIRQKVELEKYRYYFQFIIFIMEMVCMSIRWE